MIESVTLLLVVVIAFWVLCRSFVGFVFAMALQLGLRAAGLFALADEGSVEEATAYLFVGSIAALLAGYWIAVEFANRKPPTMSATMTQSARALPDRAVWAVVFVAGGLAFYHLVVGGIPLFSANIEKERFDFTSSGLFGIPGRMYLFGTSMAWILATANAFASGIRVTSYRPWRCATAIILISALLSGFKGELLSLAVMGVGVLIIVSGKRVRFGSLLKQYWWAGVLAIGYFVSVASLYGTYKTSQDSLVSQLVSRMTVVSAEPTAVALEGYAWRGHFDVLVNDLLYFTTKYAGGSVDGRYSFERLVSASIIGADPASRAWAPPVTLGGFAEMTATGGPILGFLAMFITGACLAKAEMSRNRSAIPVAIRALFGLIATMWVLKGGLVYAVLNHLVVAAILAMVACVAVLLFPHEKRDVRGLPRRGDARNMTRSPIRERVTS